MAVNFTQATTVALDEKVVSQDYNRLALAFNDRLKNGVGDPTWRMLWYAHSLVRQIRNPNAGFLYPAEDEWWKLYSLLKESSNITWPVAGGGDPEGVNVTNPLGAFVYGSWPAIFDEPSRINKNGQFDPTGEDITAAPTGVPLLLGSPPGAPTTDQDYWDLAKYQRGAVPEDLSDYAAANAIKAGTEHGKIQYPDSHFYLKNYGGQLPSPKLNSGTPICSNNLTLNFDLKFTNLVGGADKTYDTCPPDGVQYWYETLTDYVVVKWDGTEEKLAISDYIEGPYTDNAYLRKAKGQQLEQTINWFVSEFRASQTERDSSDFNRLDLGFDFQTFMSRQYALAPAHGSLSGNTLTATYPEFKLENAEPATTYFDCNTAPHASDTKYIVPADFIFAGYFVKTEGASGSGTVEIEVYDDTAVVDTFSITHTAGSNSYRLYYFPSAYKEATIRFRLGASTNLPSGVGITIEAAMLLNYKPTIQDAYVVLRLGSTTGASGFDKSGYTFDSPSTISDKILDKGVIYNTAAGIESPPDKMNENPVHEAARRLIKDNMRMAERHQLVGYAMKDSKSRLYFKRYARGHNFSGSEIVNYDLFEGMAPPDDTVASGDLVEGEEYQVWSANGLGTITYDGTVYNPITSAGHTHGEMAGTFFTATSISTFTAAGDGVVRVRNGIRSSPLKDDTNDRFRGQTNEWTTFQTTNVYKLSDSSIYKADAFGDIIGFLTDRCTFLSHDWSKMGGPHSDATELNNFYNYGTRMVLRPENPSAHRYSLNSHNAGSSTPNTLIASQNSTEAESGDQNHYESCQQHKPDYEIEAIYIDPTSYYAGNDYEIIIKLTGSLEAEAGPSEIKNVATGTDSWNAAITGYTWNRRTDELAVLEYLYHIHSYNDPVADYNCTVRVGDIAYDANSSSGYYGSDFHGNCYPRFYFTKQVRHVWNDSNGIYNIEDTPTFLDEMIYMEFILQAICSGYLDKESTLQLSCKDSPRLYDYTFPTLCYQALKLSNTEVTAITATRSVDTFTWEADPTANYTLVGVDGSGNEDVIAAPVKSPHTETGATSYSSYKAYPVGTNADDRQIIAHTASTSGTTDQDDVITFSEDNAANVRYILQGRTATSGNTNAWDYYTGSGWSSSESSAATITSPETIDSADIKDEYRVLAVAYGRKRWFEFLPPSLRPENAQGFGPLPGTYWYSRIFNNLANAVNLLVRARVDIPVSFETRDGVTSYYEAGQGASGIVNTDGPPFDYGCASTTKIAGIDNYSGLEDECEAAYSEVDAVTDPGLPTAASAWSPSLVTKSEYKVSYGPFAYSGCAEGVLIDSNQDFMLISQGYKGEIRMKDDTIKFTLPTRIRQQFIDAPGIIGQLFHDMTRNVRDAVNGDQLTIGPEPPENWGTYKYRAIDREHYECVLLDDLNGEVDAKNSILWGEFAKTAALAYRQETISGVNYFPGRNTVIRLQFTVRSDKPAFIRIPLVSADYSTSTY